MQLEVRSHTREQMIEITDRVAEAIARLGVRNGIVLVHSLHTTAGVTINEAADPDVRADILAGLSRLVPAQAGWRHTEGNSDAHLKTSLVGASATIPVVDGELRLGRWQGIFLCEFDGPRTRTLVVAAHEQRDS